MTPDAAFAQAGRAAAAALWRGVKRITTNDLFLVSLVLGALIVIFFYDIVFLGRTLVTSATQPGVMGFSPPFGYPAGHPDSNPYLIDPLASAGGAEPIVQRMGGLIRDLEFSLWNPNIALGRPFLAGASNANFSPIRLPLMLWPTPEMWDAFLLTRFFVAGLFTYLLAKRLGLAKPAALGAAVAFTFSGFFMLKVNMEHVDYAMLIPVLLYAFELLLEQPGPARMTFAVAAVAVGVLAVNVQPALLLLSYGAAYYVARIITLRVSDSGLRIWPRILTLGLALGLGVGLTAFVLVPFLELAGVPGFHEIGVHRHEHRGLHFDHLSALISLFVPYFNGAPVRALDGSGWTGIRNYVGVSIPLLAFIGLWNRAAMGRAGIFFLATAVVLLAKMYGVPVVNWVGHLPLLNNLDFPQYLPPVITFSLAMLAGLGLDQLGRTGWRWWHPLLAVVVLASLLGWLVWLNRGLLDGIPNNHLAAYLGFAAVVIIAAAAITLATRWGPLPPYAGMALLTGLIAVEFFIFTSPTRGEIELTAALYGEGSIPVIERPQRYDPFTQPPYVSFLKEDTSKYRVVGLTGMLFPNTSEVYNIDDIRGLEGISVQRYMQYIKAFISPGTQEHRFNGLGWLSSNVGDSLSLLAENPMLDLLNVKYVITPQYLPLAYDYRLAARFLPAEQKEGATGRLDVFTINGEDELVLFQHPVSSLSYAFTPDEESKFLLFRLGMDPQVWQPDQGDGVLFTVSMEENGRNRTLFSRWVDPKNNPEDRRWIDGMVDLSPYLGQPITLTLSTSPGDSLEWDWAGWGALRLAASPQAPPDRSFSSQFELVYDGEAKVYENRDAFPRAFIVHRAIPAATQNAAVTLMKQQDFDPSTSAVIEGDLPDEQMASLAGSPLVDGSSVEITSYDNSRVELLARMETAGLLILGDTYYPGWKAYLDGEQVPIYPSDLTLRSVFVPAGEHELKFVFSPGSFKLGLPITFASFAALLLCVAWIPSRRAARRWIKKHDG